MLIIYTYLLYYLWEEFVFSKLSNEYQIDLILAWYFVKSLNKLNEIGYLVNGNS